MARVSCYTFVAFVAIFMNEIVYLSTQDSCSSHADCDSNNVCCKGLYHLTPMNYTYFERRCRPNAKSDKLNFSCYGHSCTYDSDCEEVWNGEQLCCRPENVCGPCHKCHQIHDCFPYYCCIKHNWYEQSQCSHSCLGQRCQSSSDCGNDCCRLRKCVKCSECTLHSECKHQQYCCKEASYHGGQCQAECIDHFCEKHDDCAFRHRECCKSNKCVKCPVCLDNTECYGSGKYCCKADLKAEAACASTCLGYSCTNDNYCGPPDECCISGMCTRCGNLCKSNSDCFNGAFCCKGFSSFVSKCGASCIGNLCFNDSDCGEPETWCDEGKCSHIYTKECNSDSECVMQDGKKYYCCSVTSVYGPEFQKVCSSHRCLQNVACNSDHDCDNPDECCRSDVCTSSDCRPAFPDWALFLLFGVLAVILWGLFGWFCNRWVKRQRTMRQGTMRQRTVEAIRESEDTGNESNETQGIPSARGTPLPISPLRTQVRVFIPRPGRATNEYVGMELRTLNGNDEGGPNRPPPSYSVASSRVVAGTADNPNLPPPPYSFDDQAVSTERSNDQPPSYQA